MQWYYYPLSNHRSLSIHQLYSKICSSRLSSQQVYLLSCCIIYPVQRIFMVILIMCLDYKGCTLAMLRLLQFTTEFT